MAMAAPAQTPMRLLATMMRMMRAPPALSSSVMGNGACVQAGSIAVTENLPAGEGWGKRGAWRPMAVAAEEACASSPSSSSSLSWWGQRATTAFAASCHRAFVEASWACAVSPQNAPSDMAGEAGWNSHGVVTTEGAPDNLGHVGGIDVGILSIKRTYQPSTLRRKRTHGFLTRNRIKKKVFGGHAGGEDEFAITSGGGRTGGRKVIDRRRAKGRWRLAC